MTMEIFTIGINFFFFFFVLQFIEDRLDMLNSGTGFNDEFEFEVNSYEVNSNNNLRSQYKEWVTTMKVCAIDCYYECFI